MADRYRTFTNGAGANPRAPRSGPTTRVILADDHGVLREALRLLLESLGDIMVVGEATNGREAVDLAERLKPDVVLMDMAMPGLNGVEATRQLRKRTPAVRVLMLTGYAQDEQIVEALRAGASGYLVKSSDVGELQLAIQTVSRGNTYLSSVLSQGEKAQDYFWRARDPRNRGDDVLSNREREVLQLIAEGMTNQAIANELFISVKTVEAHKAHILTKLNLRNRTDLIRYALRRGMIGLDSAPPDLLGPAQVAV